MHWEDTLSNQLSYSARDRECFLKFILCVIMLNIYIVPKSDLRNRVGQENLISIRIFPALFSPSPWEAMEKVFSLSFSVNMCNTRGLITLLPPGSQALRESGSGPAPRRCGWLPCDQKGRALGPCLAPSAPGSLVVAAIGPRLVTSGSHPPWPGIAHSPAPPSCPGPPLVGAQGGLQHLGAQHLYCIGLGCF